MKGRAEACGHRKWGGERGETPTVSLGYMYARGEQETEEEKGMPIAVVKDDKKKMVMAKVVPSKGAQEYTVEAVRKFVEQLGHKS